MIAVQLKAFKIDESNIVLHAVTVLDITEDAPEDYIAGDVEETDRKYWEKIRLPGSLEIMDKIVSALKEHGVEVRLAYNKGHIALGSTGNNYCWFHPRKTAGFCHMDFKLTSELRDAQPALLEKDGVDASAGGATRIRLSISSKAIDERLTPIVAALKQAEESSR